MMAGRLRHVVTIQEPYDGFNEYREPVRLWHDVATVRAAVEPLTGRAFFAAAQVQSDLSTRIRMRYHPEVTQKSRIKYGERYFDVRTVINIDERNRELELLCTEHSTGAE